VWGPEFKIPLPPKKKLINKNKVLKFKKMHTLFIFDPVS
jgi:hypothetical protein